MPKRNKPQGRISQRDPEEPEMEIGLEGLLAIARSSALMEVSHDKESVVALAAAICLVNAAIMSWQGLDSEKWEAAELELQQKYLSAADTEEVQAIVDYARDNFALFVPVVCTLRERLDEPVTEALFQAVLMTVLYGTPENAFAHLEDMENAANPTEGLDLSEFYIPRG